MAIDKLNPLRTKFDITIEVDDEPYDLVFKPVNKIIKEKLDLDLNATKAQYEDIDSKRVELKEILELKSVNDDLLKTHGEDGGIKTEHRTAILLENKDYVTRISLLEKDIANLDKQVLDVNSAVEVHFKKMFEECVSGKDKLKLQKIIDENGIAYSVVNVYLNRAVREIQEKK